MIVKQLILATLVSLNYSTALKLSATSQCDDNSHLFICHNLAHTLTLACNQ